MTMPRFPFSIRALSASSIVVAVALLGAAALRAQTTVEQVPESPQSAMATQVTDLQKVADRWDDAIDQHDQYALELVLAPQYISISDTGEVRNRDQVVSDMVAQGAPRYTLAQKVTSVREVGDVAVVNGTYDRTFQGSRLSHTRTHSQQGVFSQVYVRARNTWQCINSQRTLIAAANGASSKKKSKDASGGESLHHDLGFHLPGLHHSDSSSQ